ncbi:MAG: hypothetical protein OXO52_16005 [Rhodospirillales bacterium]|nr:hypothetical protein [Rhodospirillales bacterium]MDE0377841.1 hypothetical protein [Rhodospirillales bacterium]
MADIFREVDEDLRHERYLKLWRRWRYWLLGVGVAALGAAVAYVMLADAQESARKAEGQQFAAAMAEIQAGRGAEAANRLAMLAADAETGYAALARLGEADARARRGDITGAIQVYDLLAGDSRIDPLYRDLGALLAAQRSVDRASVSEVNQRLAPLLAGNSPWRPLAAEISAIAEMRAGNVEASRALFAELVGDPAAPLGQRQRAAELLVSLGGDLETALAGGGASAQWEDDDAAGSSQEAAE